MTASMGPKSSVVAHSMPGRTRSMTVGPIQHPPPKPPGGTGRDGEMVLGPAEAERTLAEGGRATVDGPRHGGRPDEADGANVGVIDQHLHGRPIAVHDREDTGRKAGVDHQLAEPACRE